MKQFYLFLTIAIALSLPIQAQLSGTVTIDDGAPASATNYTSFSTLASTLNTAGINGPLVVNVMPGSGPYDGQVEFLQVPGTSAMNKIYVNGNGCVLTTTTAAPYNLRLNGTDRMQWNNMNFLSTTQVSYNCELIGGADYNIFAACTFSSSSANAAYHVQLGTSTATTFVPNSYNRFSYCSFFNGNWGVNEQPSVSGNPPFNTGNIFENCLFRDCIHALTSQRSRNLSVRFCTFENPNSVSSGVATEFYYTAGLLCEGNYIHTLFGAAPTTTKSMFPINATYHSLPAGVAPNIIRNNIISCQSAMGSIYALYAIRIDGFVYHNTIVIDDQVAGSGGFVYGVYTYGGSGNPQDSTRFKNNIVSVTRSGTATKYALYTGGVPNWGVSDYNVLYTDTNLPSNYNTYLSNTNIKFSDTQAEGSDLHSFGVNPMFSSSSGCRPVPTNTLIDNKGTPLGVMLDANQSWRNMLTPDMGALESPAGPCAGTPSNSIVGPSTVCPGTSFDLLTGLNNNFTDLTLSWESSNSPNGPFVTIPNAKSVMYNESAVFADTYYHAVLTCTLPGGGTSVSTFSVKVAGTKFDTVPYFEHFESLGKNDALPNCSWLASDLGNANQTYTLPAAPGRFPYAGSGFASFFNVSPGTSQFYSNGVFLKAGVTYSAAVWYNRDNSSASNFTNISIFYATSQNSTAITNIKSVTPLASSAYQLLDGTFTVASTGTYYIGVGAASTYSTASFLLLDDLSVTIPCTGTGSGNNGVNVVVSGSSVVCMGQSVLLTASGADTYQWATGPGTNSFLVSPAQTSTYNVVGTNALSGCNEAAAYAVNVQNCASVKEIPAAAPRIYPSPFSEELSIEWTTGKSRIISLTDVTGRVVYSGTTSEVSVTLPTSGLSKGIYLLKITTGKEVDTRKVVKD
jgi:hypothetical protein